MYIMIVNMYMYVWVCIKTNWSRTSHGKYLQYALYVYIVVMHHDSA